MEENKDMGDGEPKNLAEQREALAAFDKLDCAIRLIEEAIKEQPILKELQMEPLLRALAQGLKILSTKDSALDLQGLMLKHEWRVGQRFFVRVSVRSASECSFVALPGQDIPEGVVIVGHRLQTKVQDGEHVALDIQIQRGVRKLAWQIRAIDRE